jgi:DNA polymerase-3 subunit epsilon
VVDSGFIVLDIETTGLRCPPEQTGQTRQSGGANVPWESGDAYDEILQLAIVDAAGSTLFYDGFKPTKRKSWAQAQRVHGITPNDVKGKAPFGSRKDEIQGIIDAGGLIVTYNAGFDLGFLSAQGIALKGRRYLCLMTEFARFHGRKGGRRRWYTWQSLEVCARHYGVANPRAHDALADALTTLRCYQSFMREGRREVRGKEWGIC